MSASTISVAETKAHISEFIAKSQHAHERFIITRRNKPVAALVSIEDLRLLEQHQEKQGLAAIAGQWKGFDEVVEGMGDLSSLRDAGGMGRDVSL
uniref:Antitoxin n=1 Tax=uncultured Thiotrichaceae bacterium TaxID=298394 RepID=A0A6S6STE6_9GAMM|nr:MAG: Antitoxin [uncultured Thiotrichaceae bacterium]